MLDFFNIPIFISISFYLIEILFNLSALQTNNCQKLKSVRLIGKRLKKFLTLATRVCFQLITWHRIWDGTCFGNGIDCFDLIYFAPHHLLKAP